MKKKFNIIFVIAAFCLIYAQNSIANNLILSKLDNQNQSEITESINWDSKIGLQLLNESDYKNDFYQLLNFYQPQINPLYCSAATGVIILNALNYGQIPNQINQQIIKPSEIGGGIIEFNLYNQQDFFNEQTDLIKNKQIIDLKAPKTIKYNRANYDPGLTLDEFADILSKTYELEVNKIHINLINQEISENFTKSLIEILKDNNSFLVVNFDGKILGKETRGHISPIVAYNEKNNKVLIMDVALHKNKWFWTDLDFLLKAMNTKDGKNYRGYLVISKK